MGRRRKLERLWEAEAADRSINLLWPCPSPSERKGPVAHSGADNSLGDCPLCRKPVSDAEQYIAGPPQQSWTCRPAARRTGLLHRRPPPLPLNSLPSASSPGTCSKCGCHAFHFECTAEYCDRVRHGWGLPVCSRAPSRLLRPPRHCRNILCCSNRTVQVARESNSSRNSREKGRNIARNRPQVSWAPARPASTCDLDLFVDLLPCQTCPAAALASPQDLLAQNRVVQRKPQPCTDRSCSGASAATGPSAVPLLTSLPAPTIRRSDGGCRTNQAAKGLSRSRGGVFG